MFSGGEDCTIKLSVEWSELLSQKKMISKAVHVYGLDWSLHLDVDQFFLNMSVGFKQIPDTPVSCCATQIRYIIDSNDLNGARYTITRGTLPVLDIKSNSVYVFRNEIEDWLLNDGWMTVFAKLKIFEPVQFTSPIPAHFAYSFSAPAQCLYPVAERNGLLYLLAKHHDVSEDTQEWAVQYMIPFDKESTVTLAMIQVKPKAFIGTNINMETKQIAVTQMDKEGERIQLDLVDLSGGVQTREYPLPEDYDVFYWGRAAVITNKGLIMAEKTNGDEDDEDDGISVGYRFWLLADEMTVFSHVTRHYDTNSLNISRLQSLSYNALYCVFISPTDQQWDLLVCDLNEPGSVWKEYEMCPTPRMGTYGILLYVWPEPVLALQISIDDGERIFLFGLKFTTTDCLLVPFMSLPQGLAVDLSRKNVFNPDSLLSLDVERNELMLLHWTVPRLKTLALVQVQRLLRMDGLGQPMWTQWRDKLARIMGTKTLTHLLTNTLR